MTKFHADSPVLNTINSIVIFSYLYFNIWIKALGYPFNTILITDIYVALEQEWCLPSRSEYIWLIAIILDLPSEYN